MVINVMFCYLFQRFAPFPAAPIVCVVAGRCQCEEGWEGTTCDSRRVIQSVKSMESAETDSVSVSPVGRESTALLVCQNNPNCFILLYDIITQCYIYYYTIQKFEVSMIVYVILKGTNNKDMYNATKDLNKFCIYDNKKCFLSTKLKIIMYEGSCDTENSALPSQE